MPHPSSSPLSRRAARSAPRRAGAALVALGCTAGLLAASGSPTASAAPSGPAARAAASAAASSVGARADAGPRAVRAREQARSALRESTPIGAEDALVPTDTVLDDDGSSHVRLARTHDDLEVVGGDVVVHADPDGTTESVTGEVEPLALSTDPDVGAPEAASTAVAAVDVGRVEQASPELVVLTRPAGARLSWRVAVTGRRADGSPAGEHVFVDAASGRVLESWPSVHAETGSGRGVYSGRVPLDTTRRDSGRFVLRDPVRGGSRTLDNTGSGAATLFGDGDNVWGNGRRTGRQSAGVDVHWGSARTWDYYLERHGRLGIGGDGVGARGIVHDGPYVNAFWSDDCFCMHYGDGAPRQGYGPVVALDVVGHEMTHGVTSRTANLVYRGEPGGLNEATSDILGTSVEFYADKGRATKRGDYVIGEDVFLRRDPSTRFFRRMDRPSRDGRSQDCRNRRTKDLDVHYSSGPANHFFYLLAEGSGRKRINGVRYNSPTCNGRTVRGIGRYAAERIWFRALTVYMVPRTGYPGARRATVRAAGDLYGTGSTQVTRVRAAWSAVNVR